MNSEYKLFSMKEEDVELNKDIHFLYKNKND
jgi:hypothetical protein